MFFFSGVDKVRSASLLMSSIEHSLANHCITAKIEDSFIQKQNEILGNVLQTQLKFIQKHATATVIIANSSKSNLRRSYTEPDNVRKTVNEIAEVILTLSIALERTLCSSKVDDDTRNFNGLEDEVQQVFEHEPARTNTRSLNTCQCIEEYCAGECSEDCESICLQRYQIRRYECVAVSNKETISLDLICDGKLDCYDEADESECLTGKSFYY